LGWTGNVDPSFRRTIAIAAILIAVTYLTFSGVYSQSAPMGDWKNQIFGQSAWSEWDPGGPYVDAAHQLAWGQGQLFEGHPGTVLILLLSGLQHVYYTVAGFGTGFGFTEFTARNLPTVFVLSKLMLTLLHLVACFVTFLLAKRVLRDERAAAFAALGYATSLPVGYYLSRISVEPLVVIFFVLSLLAIWRYQDLALEQRLAPALGFVGLSATLAVSGVVTKLNFLAPLVPFLALYVLLGGWREGNERLVPGPTRLLALLVFTGTAAAIGIFYSQFIDWPGFFALWRVFAGQEAPAWALVNLLPGFAPGRIFPLCELVFIILAAGGWVAFLRENPEQRTRALWLSAFGVWGLLMFGYRISSVASFLPFHYFHVSNVVVAVFFGHAVMLALRRLPVAIDGWRAASLGLLGVILIHSVTVWTVINTRRQDAALYAPNQHIHSVISNLSPEQRLGCVHCDDLMQPRPSGFFPTWYPLSAVGWTTGRRPEINSRLADEFASIFVPVTRNDLGRDARPIRLTAVKAVVFVLDGHTAARAADPQRKR
jgi:hypothetical protein